MISEFSGIFGAAGSAHEYAECEGGRIGKYYDQNDEI